MPVRPLIDSLLLYDPNRSTSTANVWVVHPSPSEEAALGKLFMVTSLDSADRLNHEIISTIQDQLKQSYYHSTEPKFSVAFEQALHQTNQHLHRLVIEGIDGWIERLHCLVGVIHHDQLVISTAGQIIAYLLRRGRMHDILDGQTAAPNPLRVFSNIIEGHLEDQDRALFCTPTVLDYFSLEKLRRTMNEHTPAESVRLLESALLGSEQHIALGALMVKIEGQVSNQTLVAPLGRELGRPTTVAPQRSMEHLIARERATEKLLTPSVWPSIRDTISHLSHGVSSLVRTQVFRRPPKRSLPGGGNSTLIRRTSSPPAIARWRLMSLQLFRRLGHLLRSAVQSIRRPIQRSRSARALTQTPSTPAWPRAHSSWFNRLTAWFQALPTRQRLLIGLGVLLVFTFSAATVISQTGSNSSTSNPDELKAQIEDHLTKAEAALLYGGEDTARTQMGLAAAALEKFPDRSKSDRTRRQPLADRLASVRTQLTRLITVANPEIIAQLAEAAPNLRPRQLYWSGDYVFSYDPAQQSGIALNLATADAPSVIRNTIDTGQPTTGTAVAPGIILFATERQGFVELDVATSAWRPLDSAWPAGTYAVQSLSFFQNRVYALDRTQGDLVRFARGASSLGTGVRWLKESAELKLARAVAVDGSLFILQPGGRVQEYFNGRRGEFALTAIDPPLTDATRLWTSAEATRLYLVDPANRRIVVFDKHGKLVRQYQSGSWTALVDIAIDERQKTALVMSGTTLYRLTLQD